MIWCWNRLYLDRLCDCRSAMPQDIAPESDQSILEKAKGVVLEVHGSARE